MKPSRDAWVAQMAGARALAKFLDVAREARVEVVIVKGAVTAFLLYDDVAERPVVDVDARIRPRDRVTLREAAKKRGFRVLEDGGPYDKLALALGDVVVDVECHVGAPGMTQLRTEHLLASAVDVVHPLGFHVPVPHVSLHALVLAINCFKDKLGLATAWALEDARRVVHANGFSIDTFVARAREARASSLVVLVAEHLGGDVWDEVRRRVLADARPSYLVAYRWLAGRSREGAAFRALTRIASDAPIAWPRALVTAAAFEWTSRS